MRTFVLVLFWLLWVVPADAQLWSGIISPARATDWTTAGATIVDRQTNCTTTACNTLFAGTVTSASLTSAIESAPANTVVRIPAGTFTLTAGFAIHTNNITVRGQGANQTKLRFTGGVNGCGYSALVCFNSGDNTNPSTPDQTATWTAGYAKGTTVVILSTVTNLHVGSLLFLDQQDDTTDTGAIWMCEGGDPNCMSEGVVGFWRDGRLGQVQVTTVTAINGTNVTISPGVIMPNYRSARNPGAGWSSTLPLTGVGLENMTLDFSPGAFDSGFHGIQFDMATQSWLKGIRTIDLASSPRCTVCVYWSNKITIRDSYFYGTDSGASTHYGVETIVASAGLVENNICESLTGPLVTGQAAQGWVYGYNYCLDDIYTLSTDWMQASSYHHAIGNTYHLFEGNDGIGYTADAIHGPSYMNTTFRTRYRGYDPEGGSSGGKTLQTIAIHLYAYNRYFNLIGNILGEPGVHTDYEEAATTTTGNSGIGNVSIYMLGFSGNQGYGAPVPNDLKVKSTLFRWCNYNNVSGIICTSGEVPTGDAFYPNSIPSGNQNNLPASFYRSTKPSWFGSVIWPPIGPDVTGGNMTAQNLAGHVNKIPARLCYESMADDAAYSGATVRIFNASTCYQAVGGDTTPPMAPTNLRVS